MTSRRLQWHKCQKMSYLSLFAYLLEKISLSRGGLGHLPPRWQWDVIRNLIRGLTQMLGRSRGQAREGATRNSSQLQRCWRWVCTDMMGCESSATPSISASLCWLKQSGINGNTTISLGVLGFNLSFYKQKYLFCVEKKKCHTAWRSVRNSVKEGIGVSCGYTYKLDLTCITTT